MDTQKRTAEMAIGYAHAMTSKEIEHQVGLLKNAGCAEVFTDTKKAGRSGLENAISRLQSGGTLKVCAVNRLSRSMEEICSIMEQVKGKGARIEALDGSPEDSFLFSVLAFANDLAKKLEERENENQTDETDYKNIDPAIVELCKAINEFSGIETSESCQGFIDGHRDGHPWSVYFAPKGAISVEAYCSIEFLAWLVNGGDAQAAGFDSVMRLNSAPPALNEPGNTLYFVIEGGNRHPDEFAELIRDMRGKFFMLPELGAL